MSSNLPAQQIKFSQFITSKDVQNTIQKTLGDAKHSRRFVANILSAVSTNPGLQKCTGGSLLSGAFLGDALGLTPSPQLGQFYLVPFDKKDKQGNVIETNAVFVLGYKGYIQLALRSGYYKKINAIAVKEGELKVWNPFTEELVVEPILDDNKRDSAPTIGYYAMFEYMNGFTKAMYWSKDKMVNHADRYSPAFKKAAYKLIQEGKVPEKDMWKYSSFWYKEFDDMGLKTMLRQLISKWGIMSIDMQTAFEADDHAIDEQGTPVGYDVEPIDPDALEPSADDVPDFVQESDKGRKTTSLGDV